MLGWELGEIVVAREMLLFTFRAHFWSILGVLDGSWKPLGIFFCDLALSSNVGTRGRDLVTSGWFSLISKCPGDRCEMCDPVQFSDALLLAS